MARREVRQNPGLVDDVILVGGMLLGGYFLIKAFKPDPGKGVQQGLDQLGSHLGGAFSQFGTNSQQTIQQNAGEIGGFWDWFGTRSRATVDQNAADISGLYDNAGRLIRGNIYTPVDNTWGTSPNPLDINGGR